MLDIEIIKWGIGMAEGFEIEVFGESAIVLMYKGRSFRLFDDGEYTYDIIVYEHFLSKVLEVINKYLANNEEGYFINQSVFLWAVHRWRGADPFFFDMDCYNTTDNMKEDVITYIYNQIKG